MLVLCTASLANAALQFSLNGSTTQKEITIAPSQEFTVDIWTNAEISASGAGLWAVILDSGQGDFGGNGHYTGPLGTYNDPITGMTDNFTGIVYYNLLGLETIFPGKTGLQGTYTVWNSGPILDEFGDPTGQTYPTIPANSQLFDYITFHCLAPGDAVVKLYQISVSSGTAVLRDTLTVHQTPEPATLAILGLGALLLRRKKTA